MMARPEAWRKEVAAPRRLGPEAGPAARLQPVHAPTRCLAGARRALLPVQHSVHGVLAATDQSVMVVQTQMASAIAVRHLQMQNQTQVNA